jgi:hypothetical protein
MAFSRVAPHISMLGCRLTQTAGRRGSPNSLQRSCSSSCTQRTPAGLPSGMPGIGDEIDGAMQQAPQPLRQFIASRPAWPVCPDSQAAALRNPLRLSGLSGFAAT